MRESPTAGSRAKREATGFTLLELMVVLAIMATVTGLLIPNIRGFNNNQKLLDAANQIQSDIRLAQTNATSGIKCTNSTALAWYVNFVGNSQDTVQSYKIGTRCVNAADDQATQQTLPKDIYISKISFQYNGSTVVDCNQKNGVFLLFNNIYAQMWLSGIDNANLNKCSAYNILPTSPPDRVIITLTSSTTQTSTTVNVTKGGNIYVQ